MLLRRLASTLCVSAMVGGCFADPPTVGGDGTETESASTEGGDATATDGECLDCPAGSACVDGTCVPAGCGDGQVDEGEECDDGEDNAPDGSCKLDCTRPFCGDGHVGPAESCDDGNDEPTDGCDACVLTTCGNATVDDGEQCDDGNEVDGDGCNVDCQPSGMLVWDHFHDGSASGADRVHDVALVEGGDRLVVVGAVVDVGEQPEPWLRILDTGGTPVFSSAPPNDGDLGGETWGVDCDATCIAVGATVTGTGHFAGFARRVTADGFEGDAVVLDNYGTLGRVAYGLALGPMGADIVGYQQISVSQHYGNLSEIGPALDSGANYTYFTAPGFGHLRRIARAGDRRYAVGWHLESSLATTTGGLFVIEPDGTAQTVEIGGSPHSLGLCVAFDAQDETIVVGGMRSDSADGTLPGMAVLRRYATSGALISNEDRDFGGTFARVDDIAIAPGGDIVGVGAVRLEGDGNDHLELLVFRLSPQGEQRWQRVFEAPGTDLASGVDIDPVTGAIYVGGRRSRDGNEDAWVARFTP